MVGRILNIEGLVFFLFCLYFYHLLNGNWLIFILLLFVPDIFMLGYLVNKKIGSFIYNISHTYITSGVILFFGLLFQSNTLTLLALIFAAHISMDRTIGYGIKYKTNFKDTHLQKV